MTTGIMENADIDIDQVPVPSVLPPKVDLSQVPTNILRSGAVEALANQNEDLMARLSVALKRSSQLEERIAELESENQVVAHKFEVLKDQILVLKEKDSRAHERISEAESATGEIQRQLDLLEVQYAELYSTSKERTRSLLLQIDTHAKRISRLLRYRRKVRDLAKNLRNEHRRAIGRLRQTEEDGRELKTKLGEAAERIQSLAKAHETEQRRLVEAYEADLRNLEQKTQTLESQVQGYQEKTLRFEELQDRQIELENRLVVETRQHEQYRETAEAEIQALQASVVEFRTLAKEKTLSEERLGQETAEMREQIREKGSEVQRLQDQVESLQCLWHENQSQIEKHKQKESALQKLNQQLSATINQQRKEILDLKRRLESQQIEGHEKIKTIKADMELRDSKRIETLIAEIQSGFAPTKSESSSESLGSGATGNP